MDRGQDGARGFSRAFSRGSRSAKASRSNLTHATHATYQTRHAFCLTIGAFALHWNAFANSGMLPTGPLTR